MKKAFESKLDKLTLPKNFYAGYMHDPKLQLPDNILMFFRRGSLKTSSPNIHHRFLLFINLRDSLNLIIDGRRFVVDRNQAMLVMPHQYHLFVYDNNDVERLLITFEGCDIANMQNFKERIFELNDRFFKTLELLVDEYLEHNMNDRSAGEKTSLLLRILLMDLEKCPGRFKANKYGEEKLNLGMADNINRYIQNNLNTPLSIGQIAEEFKYSASHLRLLYRKAMGMSIGKYVRQTKIHRACGYLGSSRTTISETAKICGYSSIYAFSHAFKNEMNLYPGEYRKKHLKG